MKTFKLNRHVRSTVVKVLLSVFSCVLFLGSASVDVQAAGEELFDNTSGLVTSNINDQCQTTDGYIWIAQYEGLTKFNGEVFQCINKMNIDGEEISLNQVTAVENDSQNRLYFAAKGEGVFVYADDTFKRLTDDTGKNTNSLEVNNDVLFAATSDGAFYYKDDTITWIENTMDTEVSSISGDENTICYSDGNGIVYKYDIANNSTQEIYNDSHIKTVYMTPDALWLGSTYGDLIRISGNQTEIIRISDDHPINSIIQQDDKIFIGTDGGMYLYADGKSSRLHFSNTNTAIENVFIDYENNIWMATSNGLVEHHDYCMENIFDTYEFDQVTVNACFIYEGMLYVGTDEGILIIDMSSHTVVDNELSQTLKSIRIRDFESLDGKLYIATYSSEKYALIEYDGTNITNITSADMLGGSADKDSIFNHSQVRCLMAANGGMLIGTNYGVTYMKNGEFKTIALSPRPLSIAAYDDEFYVCTDGDGIHGFNYNLDEIENIAPTEEKTALRVIRYENGLLYGIGTILYYYESGNETAIHLGNYGSIVDIYERPEALTVCTSAGMCSIDKSTLFSDEPKLLEKFDSSNGLTSGVTANGRAAFNASTQTLYLNCQNGVYRYVPAENSSRNTRLKIAIDDVLVDGKKVPFNTVINLDKYTNRVSVDIAVLTFLNRNGISVYYKMDDMDPDFNRLDFSAKQAIDYTNIPGGTHTMSIYVQNSEGEKSDLLKIEFNKSPKLYERKLVQLIIILTLIVLVTFLTLLAIRVRMKKINEKAEWRKQVALESIEAIAHTIDNKDKYTKGHSIRVAKLSVCIGKKLHDKNLDLETLYYIGLLHDIGKVGIPDMILTKPGKLNEEEFEIMKNHPMIGHDILKSINSIPHLEDGVIYHHEKYDGTGYPNGKKGKDIPLIGRIIGCADSYDAMATRRCYKKGMSDDEIIKEFKRCSGIQFDPDIAAIVIECIKDGSFRKIVDDNPS